MHPEAGSSFHVSRDQGGGRHYVRICRGQRALSGTRWATQNVQPAGGYELAGTGPFTYVSTTYQAPSAKISARTSAAPNQADRRDILISVPPGFSRLRRTGYGVLDGA